MQTVTGVKNQQTNKPLLGGRSVWTRTDYTYFEHRETYLYVKRPGRGDDFKEIVSHHNVTTTRVENLL